MGENLTTLPERAAALVALVEGFDLVALAHHRARDGWNCSSERTPDGRFWLRIPVADAEILRRLPILGRWWIDEGGLAFRDVDRLPEKDLGKVEWVSLGKVLQLAPPARNAPAMQPFPIGFGLVRGVEPAQETAILTSWDEFERWSGTVLEQRIEPLRFVRASEGRCLAEGTPLPAVAGRGFYKTKNLWLPSGFRLPEFLWPELVVDALGLESGESALVEANGDYHVIRDDSWIEGSRAAVNVNRSSKEKGLET